jgi:hypothetical protein
MAWAFSRAIFPLFATIFLFLKKKQKGFPLQSGVELNVLGIFQTFGIYVTIQKGNFSLISQIVYLP